MSNAWEEIQTLKWKLGESRRIRLEEMKKEERKDILDQDLGESSSSYYTGGEGKKVEKGGAGSSGSDWKLGGGNGSESSPMTPIMSGPVVAAVTKTKLELETKQFNDGSFENYVLQGLADVALRLPMDSKMLFSSVNKALVTSVTHIQIVNLLQKFALQQLISVEEKLSDGGSSYIEIVSVDHTKVLAMALSTRKGWDEDEGEDGECSDSEHSGVDEDGGPTENKRAKKDGDDNDVLSLLSLPSTREKENKRIGEEILELLSRPTVKEKMLMEKFRSQGGSTVKEFCHQGTTTECCRVSGTSNPCGKVHFRKIIQSHTDELQGDCSFLNTCFSMKTCKHVHYELEESENRVQDRSNKVSNVGVHLPSLHNGATISATSSVTQAVPDTVLNPAQWIQCDLRFFDMTTLGKFSVIMADPPWDIHMELPYGTIPDADMLRLNISGLQDEGHIFLWVTGRAMELGRKCLELWGYERVDEIIWVKTNQLQKVVRTGRTGHWLNHCKEHCLVGVKGDPPVNRGLDCDVIVAEVRETSHKPDEIYGIIERLSPGTRKIELFGRPHNIQPNWTTLGNQLDGSHIADEDIQNRLKDRYPDGNYGARANKGTGSGK